MMYAKQHCQTRHPALSPQPKKRVGGEGKTVGTVTQGGARGSCLALALGYSPPPRWGFYLEEVASCRFTSPRGNRFPRHAVVLANPGFSEAEFFRPDNQFDVLVKALRPRFFGWMHWHHEQTQFHKVPFQKVTLRRRNLRRGTLSNPSSINLDPGRRQSITPSVLPLGRLFTSIARALDLSLPDNPVQCERVLLGR
jgi:hypothetical protein